MTDHTVPMVAEDGSDAGSGSFHLSRAGGRCRLRLEYGDLRLEATEGDFFEALCTIRTLLEVGGLRPRCYGASRTVFPSGIGRDMGEGLMARRLVAGRMSSMEDDVFIFDEGEDVEPASMREQWEFFREWWDQAAPGQPMPSRPRGDTLLVRAGEGEWFNQPHGYRWDMDEDAAARPPSKWHLDLERALAGRDEPPYRTVVDLTRMDWLAGLDWGFLVGTRERLSEDGGELVLILGERAARAARTLELEKRLRIVVSKGPAEAVARVLDRTSSSHR